MKIKAHNWEWAGEKVGGKSVWIVETIFDERFIAYDTESPPSYEPDSYITAEFKPFNNAEKLTPQLAFAVLDAHIKGVPYAGKLA